MPEIKNFLRKLTIEAGHLVLSYRQKLAALSVTQKNNTVRDLVSEADKAVEHFILGEILSHFPEHNVTGEELGHTGPRRLSPEIAASTNEEYHWIVDPIDGTVNFLKGSRNFSISIAVYHRSKALYATVFAPALGELYSAEAGAGASLEILEQTTGHFVTVSKQPLCVRPLKDLSAAVLITGFGCIRSGIEPNNYLYLGYILPRVSDIRRIGSAAMDLCYVAAGVFDGYWEIGLNLYDVAAGALILKEAGGIYSDFYGAEDDFPCTVIAGSPEIQRQLVEIFASIEKPSKGFRPLLEQAQSIQKGMET